MRRSLLLCAALALLGASCDAELSPGATVLQAAQQTRAEGSARVSYRALFDVASTSEPVPLTGEGLFDYGRKRGRMVFNMAGLLTSEEASETADEVEMIVDGLVLYLQMPFLAEMLPDSRPWLKVDLEAAARANRTDLVQFTQLGQGDPTQVLELLRGVTRRVVEVGREQVRDTSTTHYRTILDLARVAEDTPAETAASVQSLLARSRSREVEADVWVDADGRLRRMRYSVPLGSEPGSAQTSATAMAVTMELYDFGVSVDVTPPSEDHVIDLLGLSQQ